MYADHLQLQDDADRINAKFLSRKDYLEHLKESNLINVFISVVKKTGNFIKKRFTK